MLLIDGYNVLFARGGVGDDVRGAREALVGRIDAYCARTGQRARIYFDSRHGPMRGRLGSVEVYHVDASETADDAIVRAVDGTDDRTAYRVVSSDHAVADAARKRQMAVTSSEDFLREMEPPSGEALPEAKREGISEGEAKVWLRRFGMGGVDEAR